MENKSHSRKRFTPEQRANLVAAYRKSGLTQRTFASQAGISLACLSLWLRKEKIQPMARPMRFLQIPGPRASASVSPSAYKVQFSSGTTLEMARGFVPEELTYLCQVLCSL